MSGVPPVAECPGVWKYYRSREPDTDYEMWYSTNNTYLYGKDARVHVDGPLLLKWS